MSSPEKFVMDCSVTMSLLLLDGKKKDIQKIERLLATSRAIVPSIWRYEVANVLCMAERAKRFSEADGAEFKAILSALPIIVDELSTVKALEGTEHLAQEYGLTVYDAAYLELAMRDGLPLATFDKALKSAANKVGTVLI